MDVNDRARSLSLLILVLRFNNDLVFFKRGGGLIQHQLGDIRAIGEWAGKWSIEVKTHYSFKTCNTSELNSRLYKIKITTAVATIKARVEKNQAMTAKLK